MNIITVNNNEKEYNISIHNKQFSYNKNDNIICCFNEKEVLNKLNVNDNIYNSLFYLQNGTYILCIINNNNKFTFDLLNDLLNIKDNLVEDSSIEDNQSKNVYKILLLQKKIQKWNKICETSFKNDINFRYSLITKPLKSFNVLTIMDEFTNTCYDYEFNNIVLHKKRWKEQIDNLKLDIFLCESVWESVGSELSLKNADNIELIRTIIKYCSYNNIPTIFWNKEDDINYNKFIQIASLFDYIFTTDERCIPLYKRDTLNENIYCLEFATQPKIHNPSNNNRTKDAFFAGRWYDTMEERNTDIEKLINLDLFKNNNYILDIYDRKYITSPSFPSKYIKFVNKGLQYEALCNITKNYKIMMNVNTITESPTMFSRRVYEGLSSGCAVISTKSVGIENKFGDLVRIINNKFETEDYMKFILENNVEFEKLSHRGYSNTINIHNYENRFKQIIDTIGLNYYNKEEDIVHIFIIIRKGSVQSIIDFYKKNILNQSYTNITLSIFTTTNISTRLKKTLKEYNINIHNSISKKYITSIIGNIKNCYMCVMDINDIYYNNFIRDTLLAYLYIDDVEMVGKSCIMDLKNNIINKGKEHKYVENLHKNTIIYNKNAVLPLLYSLFDLDRFYNYNCKKYSVERWNYIMTDSG